MINADIITIDQITSNATDYIQEGLNELHSIDIKLNLGSITGVKLLSGTGPNIKLKVSSVGNISTDLKSEFISQGINQTMHRLYLQVNCKVNILVPFKTLEQNVSSQILIAENVIIGQIPNTYYNLEGIEDPQSIINTIE